MEHKEKSKAMNDPYPPVDVCCGGTIPVGQNYVPFINSTGTPQTVSNCRLWQGAAAIAATGTVIPVAITMNPKPPTGSSYSFTSTCNCPNGTLPTIKVQ